MKKKMLIIIIFLLILVTALAITLLGSNTNKTGYFKKYVGDFRSADDPWACLTFIDEHTYSLYDCDSEPTEYFFDSENECTYSYDGEYLNFDCKYKTDHEQKIRVLDWTEKEFVFEYDGYVKTFVEEN